MRQIVEVLVGPVHTYYETACDVEDCTLVDSQYQTNDEAVIAALQHTRTNDGHVVNIYTVTQVLTTSIYEER